jgi:hypothetical protein
MRIDWISRVDEQVPRASRRNATAHLAASAVIALLAGACGSAPADSSTPHCMAGTAVACTCADTRPSTSICMPDGTRYAACACAVQAAGAQSLTPPAGISGAAGTTALPPRAGSPAGIAGMTAGLAGRPAGVAGSLAIAGRPGFAGSAAPAGRSGTAGSATLPSGGSTAVAGSTGAAGATASSDQLEMVRQVCVDEINRYRAMANVPALKRGSAAQEMCSDTGAKKDGDSGTAHGSASDCKSLGLPGQQDTCPGWGVGARSGNATLADALKKCLASMWAEGEPPSGRAACQMDISGCFQKYGHYLNMSDPSPKVVACGFYQMTNGSWWMNQNFGR